MLNDIRFALRTLAKSPAFTIAAVLCLALGIGVNATIFSCVRAMLLRPFPYRDPDALVAIGESVPVRGFHMNTVSYPNFRDFQSQNRTLESMGLYSGAGYNLANGDGAEFVSGANVSWTMFRTLGVAPALGRDFREEEDRVGAPNVMIIGDRLWRDRFAGGSVLGQKVTLNGVAYTIIGVMPPGFEFPTSSQLWTTLQMDPLLYRGNHSWQIVGRLKPRVTVDQAQTDLASIAATLSAKYPGTNGGWSAEAKSLRDYQVGTLRPVLLLLSAAVALVLLIACANVANLLLARATVRSKEMSVRLAMGADGWRLVRQLLTESVILSLGGAILGVAVAFAFLQWIKGNVVGVPFWMRFTIDAPVLAFTMAVAVVTGVVFGLAPAFQAANPDLNATLRDAGARGATAGRARHRLRSGLLVSEVALSVVLLVGAALLLRSFVRLQSTSPGFDQTNLLTMRVYSTGPAYDSTYKRHAFWDRVLADLNARLGVVSAGIANNIPLGGSNNNQFFSIEGQPPATSSSQQPLLEIRWVSQRYLETMRIPLRRGRTFTTLEAADTGAMGRVAVINEHTAQHFWKTDDNAIGKRFTFGNPQDPKSQWFTIVGVAADIKDKQLTSDLDFQGYAPYQGQWSSVGLVTRTRGEPALATKTVLAALKSADATLPAYRIMSMEANIARTYWQQALYDKLLAAFAAIALVLATLGVYGVISYAVSQRTREMGVRVALGAQRRDLIRLVTGEGARLGLVGIAIGLVGALAVTRLLRSMLFGVSPFDPASFVAASLVLGGTAVVASYLPARRAAKVDPVEALQAE